MDICSPNTYYCACKGHVQVSRTLKSRCVPYIGSNWMGSTNAIDNVGQGDDDAHKYLMSSKIQGHINPMSANEGGTIMEVMPPIV